MRTIPARFQCMGHEIKVRWRDNLLEEENAWGMCIFHEHIIELQRPRRDLRVTKSHVLVTYLHEYFHMALYCLGRTEMAMDEELVDQLAQVTHQMMMTKSNS